jgi:hypothetical protein
MLIKKIPINVTGVSAEIRTQYSLGKNKVFTEINITLKMNAKRSSGTFVLPYVTAILLEQCWYKNHELTQCQPTGHDLVMTI